MPPNIIQLLAKKNSKDKSTSQNAKLPKWVRKHNHVKRLEEIINLCIFELLIQWTLRRKKKLFTKSCAPMCRDIHDITKFKKNNHMGLHGTMLCLEHKLFWVFWPKSVLMTMEMEIQELLEKFCGIDIIIPKSKWKKRWLY